jgi:hypothetical protein
VDAAVERIEIQRAPGQIGDLVERGLGLRGRRLSLDLGLECSDSTLERRVR